MILHTKKEENLRKNKTVLLDKQIYVKEVKFQNYLEIEVSFLLQICQILRMIPEEWTVVLHAYFSALKHSVITKEV
jgi:hypothetical protein